MRILDQEGNEIPFPCLDKGYLTRERLEHRYEAVAAVPEKSHYRVVKTYPNGGQDVERIMDTPAVPGREAWVEYESILRFHPYTEAELAQMRSPTPQEDTDAMLIDHELRLTLLELGMEGEM